MKHLHNYSTNLALNSRVDSSFNLFLLFHSQKSKQPACPKWTRRQECLSKKLPPVEQFFDRPSPPRRAFDRTYFLKKGAFGRDMKLHSQSFLVSPF